MDRQHSAVNGVDVLELLADQPEGQVVKPMAAVALREAHARETERGQLGEDLRVVTSGAIVGADSRRELAAAEVPDGRDQLLLVGGEGQVQHNYNLVGRADCR